MKYEAVMHEMVSLGREKEKWEKEVPFLPILEHVELIPRDGIDIRAHFRWRASLKFFSGLLICFGRCYGCGRKEC